MAIYNKNSLLIITKYFIKKLRYFVLLLLCLIFISNYTLWIIFFKLLLLKMFCTYNNVQYMLEWFVQSWFYWRSARPTSFNLKYFFNTFTKCINAHTIFQESRIHKSTRLFKCWNFSFSNCVPHVLIFVYFFF